MKNSVMKKRCRSEDQSLSRNWSESSSAHTGQLTIFSRIWLLTLVLLALILQRKSATEAAEPPLSFERDIAPIFEQHCLRCHSPNNQKGDLSLATAADLQESGYVIAGDPAGSYLLELVTSSQGKPPAMPKDAPPLSDAEVARIRQWIGEGAVWPEGLILKERSKADQTWWSLQPLTVFADHQQHSIDSFIRGKLTENKLTMSPPADRRTLIRRLSFDLHGLPPAPEEVDRFVNDADPQAYERLIDRMLASPHYGERYARHWLDLAHYADTHGFERDKRRDHAWRYRDYVIRALNEDKSYRRFLQEQIAGDVLWPDDEQAVIATGFLAAGPWDFVGQVETKSDELRRSARALDLDDMLTQVITASIGMTINCARCHDHKLDPISQQEYYQLAAVFAGVKREDRVVSEKALQEYTTAKAELTSELNRIDFAISQLSGNGLDLADIVGGGNGLGTGKFRQGLDTRTGKIQTRDFGALGNVVTNRYSLCEHNFIDGVFVPDGAAQGEAKIPVSSTGLTVTGIPQTSGKAWDMIRNGPVASQHSTELGGIDFSQNGHTLLGIHANAGITFDLTAIREETGQDDLRFTAKLGYFGAVGGFQADAFILLEGKRIGEYRSLSRDDGLRDIEIALPATVRFLTLICTDGGNGYSHDQVGFGDPKLHPATPPSLNQTDQQRLVELQQQREATSQQLKTLGPPPKFYGVVEQAVPAVHVLLRGDPESPTGKPLPPAALSSLAMLDSSLGNPDASAGERRAALAHWLTDPGNPLMSRVIVNRLWHWHFGQGIVNTPSDFGFGGGRPSHPELLDWLAAELGNQNYSLKAMHRLILLSDTYRQQSRGAENAPGMIVDADNRLLWRQNPQRIEAEAIRDSVLFVSGKLNDERGGPGFEDFTYQDAYAPIYTYVTADEPALWRRSIYRYIVRTSPNRFLTTLDCPDPANLTPQRLTTTTPLQSLALYNNDFMLRQARYFADRVQQESGPDVKAQVQRAFALAFGRSPVAEEIDLAIAFVREYGLFPLCRSLLNSNEFVYVD